MKNYFLQKTAIVSMILLGGCGSVSAFSLSGEEQNPLLGKVVAALFQGSNKLGAALVGEVTSVTLATSSSSFTIVSKQKTYTIGLSPETKVRVLGIPGNIDDMRAGDRVSVVSLVSKTETPRLRARIVSILSQAKEEAPLPPTDTADATIATSTVSTSTSPAQLEASSSQVQRKVAAPKSVEMAPIKTAR